MLPDREACEKTSTTDSKSASVEEHVESATASRALTSGGSTEDDPQAPQIDSG